MGSVIRCRFVEILAAAGGSASRTTSRLGGLADRAMFRSAQRVFWSGGRPAMNAATRWASSHGATTIGLTRAGRVLSAADRMLPGVVVRPVWRGASWMYARGAHGTVHTFVRGRPSPSSIWLRTELPQQGRECAEINCGSLGLPPPPRR